MSFKMSMDGFSARHDGLVGKGGTISRSNFNGNAFLKDVASTISEWRRRHLRGLLLGIKFLRQGLNSEGEKFTFFIGLYMELLSRRR